MRRCAETLSDEGDRNMSLVLLAAGVWERDTEDAEDSDVFWVEGATLDRKDVGVVKVCLDRPTDACRFASPSPVVFDDDIVGVTFIVENKSDEVKIIRSFGSDGEPVDVGFSFTFVRREG
jgi:hypothetical protein